MEETRRNEGGRLLGRCGERLEGSFHLYLLAMTRTVPFHFYVVASLTRSGASAGLRRISPENKGAATELFAHGPVNSYVKADEHGGEAVLTVGSVLQ